MKTSGVDHFPGKRNGLDISVKDVKRFKDTNGWGYFTGHNAPQYAKTATALAKEMRAFCQISYGTADMVGDAGHHLPLELEPPRSQLTDAYAQLPSHLSLRLLAQRHLTNRF